MIQRLVFTTTNAPCSKLFIYKLHLRSLTGLVKETLAEVGLVKK